MDGIYNNLAQKLKAQAKVILVVGIIVSIALAIWLFSLAGQSSNAWLVGGGLSTTFTWAGFIVLIIGVTASILCSYSRYALGVMVEKVENELGTQQTKNTIIKKAQYTCGVCGSVVDEGDYTCANCKNRINCDNEENTSENKSESETSAFTPLEALNNSPNNYVCSSCGAELKPDSKFCTTCGTKRT